MPHKIDKWHMTSVQLIYIARQIKLTFRNTCTHIPTHTVTGDWKFVFAQTLHNSWCKFLY